jgi:hypothetical protein
MTTSTKYVILIITTILEMGVGIAQSVQRRSGQPGVRSQAGTSDFSLLHRIQTGSGAHPAYYPIGTGGKTARV